MHSIYTLWQKEHLILKANAELGKEKRDWESLKQKLISVQKPQFVEEEARNKLLLSKPGEGVIVIPTQFDASPSAMPKPKDTRPNWKKWWETFF